MCLKEQQGIGSLSEYEFWSGNTIWVLGFLLQRLFFFSPVCSVNKRLLLFRRSCVFFFFFFLIISAWLSEGFLMLLYGIVFFFFFFFFLMISVCLSEKVPHPLHCTIF